MTTLLTLLDVGIPNPEGVDVDSLLSSLSSVANEVIKSGSGIGFNKPFADPASPLCPLFQYFKSKTIEPGSSLLIAHDRAFVPLGALVLANTLASSRGQAKRHRVDVQCFFTDPMLRGNGVGSLLLAQAEAFARSLSPKVTHLTLDARSTQTSAISLYEQAGFKVWGTLEDYAIGEKWRGH